MLFVHLISLNIFEVVLGVNKGGSKQFLQFLPVIVETLDAEIPVERVAVCGSDYSGFGVGASLFVVEIELFN